MFCDLEYIKDLHNLNNTKIVDNLPPAVKEIKVSNTVVPDDLKNLQRSC